MNQNQFKRILIRPIVIRAGEDFDPLLFNHSWIENTKKTPPYHLVVSATSVTAHRSFVLSCEDANNPNDAFVIGVVTRESADQKDNPANCVSVDSMLREGEYGKARLLGAAITLLSQLSANVASVTVVHAGRICSYNEHALSLAKVTQYVRSQRKLSFSVEAPIPKIIKQGNIVQSLKTSVDYVIEHGPVFR